MVVVLMEDQSREATRMMSAMPLGTPPKEEMACHGLSVTFCFKLPQLSNLSFSRVKKKVK